MKPKSYILILLALACGVLVGYYIGKHTKTMEQSEELSETNGKSNSLPVYDGPFGLDMGLSLDDVEQVCKIEHMESDLYEITPPETNDMFEAYYVRIDKEYGIYWMRAISDDIVTNDNGTGLKLVFENIVESLGNKYGKYERTDRNSNHLFDDPQYFMYTLGEGSRELSAVWAKKHRSQLPDDIAGIGLAALAENSFSEIGYVILEYRFSNTDAVDAKVDSVF